MIKTRGKQISLKNCTNLLSSKEKNITWVSFLEKWIFIYTISLLPLRFPFLLWNDLFRNMFRWLYMPTNFLNPIVSFSFVLSSKLELTSHSINSNQEYLLIILMLFASAVHYSKIDNPPWLSVFLMEEVLEALLSENAPSLLPTWEEKARRSLLQNSFHLYSLLGHLGWSSSELFLLNMLQCLF